MKRFLSMMVALIILTSHAPVSCAENGERPIGSSEVILENIYTETDLPEGDPQINDSLVIEENYGEDSINETSSNTEESDDIPSEDTEIITDITYRDSDNDLGNDKNDESTTIPQIEDIINSNFYSDKDHTTEDEEMEDVFDQPSSNENDAGNLLILSDLEIGADFDDEDNEAKDAEAVADEESECAIESVSDYENIDAAEIIECSIDPIVVSSMKLMSVSINTPSESHLMNIKVDDIVVGNPFTISWNEIEHCNHYEIAIVRIDTSDRESYITSGVNNRESLGSTTHSYTVPGSSVPSGTKSFRIYVGAASTEYPCDWSKMIKDNTVTITVRAAVNQDINISISVNGASANVSWEKVISADFYLYSVYNITKGSYIYNRQETTNKSLSINGISSGDKYRIWVGAYANGNADPIAQHLEEITLRVDCTHELTMPDSTEHGYYKESEITDTYHIIYDRYNLVCKTCGKKVQENVEECLGQEAHRYSDNGVCIVCHYAGSECRHVNTHKEYTRTEYEAEGKNTHTEIKYFDVVCDYCNAIIPLKTSETIAKDRSEKTEGLSHNFKNGTCKDCGYIKAAQLTVTLQRGQATAKVGDMITATASIAGGSGTYQMLWKVYCDNICENDDVTGKWISGLEHSVSYETDKAGNWYFEAIVTDTEDEETSGKTQNIVVSEAECEHDYQEILCADLTKYEKVNDTQHRIIYTHQLVCMKCDDVKNTWISDEYKDHEYDEDGKCVCGAIKEVDPECVHEWVSTVNETRYEQTERNDRMEKHAVITVYKDVCSKCGTESSHETTEYAGHVFEKGKCICGYVEVTDCDHANKKEEEIGTPTYVNDSEKGHIKTVKVKITCADCGVVLEEEKETSVFETHKYVEGVCVCGQLEHVHTYEKITVGDPKYAIVDEAQHSITTTYYERCTGCGETTEQKTETVNEAHIFDYQGYESEHPHQYFKRCSACKSASLIPEKYNTANGAVQDKSNCCICYGHAWNIGNPQYSNGKWYVACRKCGLLREASAPIADDYSTTEGLTAIPTTKVSPDVTKQPTVTTIHHSENTCEHTFVIIDSAHPHTTITKKCTKCGELIVENSNTGKCIESCPICYPKSNPSSGINKSDVYNAAKDRYGSLAQYAYDSDGYNRKDPLPKNKIRVEHPDCLIETNTTADGKLVLTFAFEGSQGNGPLTAIFSAAGAAFSNDLSKLDDHNAIESFEDWWYTDFNTNKTQNGIQAGFENAVIEFIQLYGNRETLNIPNFSGTLKQTCTIAEALEYARDNPDEIIIEVTGHSLGGALAQVFTYHLLNDFGIDKKSIYTYTFASPVPFTWHTIEGEQYDNLNVYNFINVRDFVPKYGVTDAENLPFGGFGETYLNEIVNGLVMLENARDASHKDHSGGMVLSGINLGYNIYLNGSAAKDLIGEHLMSNYNALLKNVNTEYDVIDTREVIEIRDYILSIEEEERQEEKRRQEGYTRQMQELWESSHKDGAGDIITKEELEVIQQKQEENKRQQEEYLKQIQESWKNSHKDGAGDLMP